MGKQTSKGISFLYLFPIIIIFQTFSLLWGWVPQTKLPYFLYLGIFVGLMACSKYFTQPKIIALLIYAIVLYVNLQMGDFWWSTNFKVALDIIRLALTGCMGYAIMTSNDRRLLTITIVSFLIILIINAIGTSIVETIIPGSIRTLTEMEIKGGDDRTIWLYYRYGLANYFLPSALVSVIPMMVLGIKVNKDNKLKRCLLILGLISSLMLTYYSGSMTAFLLGVSGFLVALFFKPKNNRSQWLRLGLLGVLLLVVLSNDQFMLSFLQTLDGLVGNDGYFHDKIVDFEILIQYGETYGDIETREGLYTETWKAIAESPLVGVNNEIGNHSLLLDHWGYLGLVGFIPFLFFIIVQIKQSIRLIPLASKPFYFICIAITFIMMMTKNLDSWEAWLCLFTILPLLSVYCFYDIRKEENTDGTIRHYRL